MDASTLARIMREKYEKRVRMAADDYKTGIENVTENPAALAAANADVWFARIQEAYRNKTFSSKLGRISLEEWKKSVMDYGVDNYSRAATTKAPAKYGSKVDKLASTALEISKAAKAIKKVDKASALKRVEIAYDRWKAIKGTV